MMFNWRGALDRNSIGVPPQAGSERQRRSPPVESGDGYYIEHVIRLSTDRRLERTGPCAELHSQEPRS